MDKMKLWDDRYKHKECTLFKPDSFIVDNVDNLSFGDLYGYIFKNIH